MDAVGGVQLGLLQREKRKGETVNRSEVRGEKRRQRENGNAQDSLEFTLDEMGKDHVIRIPRAEVVRRK
jgi:hypothetical protein